MNCRSILVLIFFASLLQGRAATSTTEAEKRLRGAVEEVLAVADRVKDHRTLAEKVRPILLKHISFDTMTRRAVGPGWRQFSSEQQRKATQLFTTLVIRTYTNKFTPGEHPAINYKAAVSPAPGRVDVPTTLLYQGSHYSVTYRMEQESSLRVVDVVIEGVSMIANYRTQLDAQFKRGGAAAAIASLEQSVSHPQ
jgi:phospholipid transport system substrate-binding protein